MKLSALLQGVSILVVLLIGQYVIVFSITRPEWNTPNASVLFVGSSHVQNAIDQASFSQQVGELAVRGMSQDIGTVALVGNREHWPRLQVLMVELDEFMILTERLPRETHDLSELCGKLSLSVWDFPVSQDDYELRARRAWTFLDGKGSEALYEPNRFTLRNWIPRLELPLRRALGGELPERGGEKKVQRIGELNEAAALARVDFVQSRMALSPAANVTALMRMLQFAEQEGLRVVCISYPVSDSYAAARPAEWDRLLEQMLAKVRTASGQEIPHWDYRNHADFLEEDLKDIDHLNENGARKLSRLLSVRLAEEGF